MIYYSGISLEPSRRVFPPPREVSTGERSLVRACMYFAMSGLDCIRKLDKFSENPDKLRVKVRMYY